MRLQQLDMPSKRLLAAFTVANLAILYQWVFKEALFVSYGVMRELQPLSEFPYTCRRITDHNIAACEDAWIDDSSRQLFLGCSNALGRKAWNPNMAFFAAERRSRTDHIVALSLDVPHPQDPSAFDYRILSLGDFRNSLGDPEINILSVTGRTISDGTLQLYFVNNAPMFNATTQRLAPQAVTGPNATVEVFSMSPHAEGLTHMHTFFNREYITTPNNVAVMADGSVYISNDHGPNKAGLGHTISPMISTGTIVHCLPPTAPDQSAVCQRVGDKHKFPNGLHLSRKDGLLYVPSSVTGKITVYQPSANGTLTRVADIPVGMPLDNISEDADGDLYVVGFPKLTQMEHLLKQSTPIDGSGAATSTFRIHRKGETGREWEVEKVLEDPNGDVLPASTTAVRDAKTGRLFLVGIVSPWFAVCDPK